MSVQDVWVITMEKDGKYLICNMKWLIEHRAFGVVAFEEAATSLKNIDYEIKLSNGNMKWVDSIEGLTVVDFTDITSKENNWDSGKAAIHTGTDAMIVAKTQSGIETMHEWDDGTGVYVDDREDEVSKLNKRLKLIGSEDQYFTNGVDLMLLTSKPPKSVNPYMKYIDFDISKKLKIQGDVDVSDWDFLGLDDFYYDYDTLVIKAKGAKKLRYLALASESHAFEFDENIYTSHCVDIADNIDIESAVNVELIPANIKRFKRLYNCIAGLNSNFGRKWVTLDLSGIDYIGHKGLIPGHYMGKVVLDFKDKYTILCKDAIYITDRGKRYNQKVIVRYSNTEMHEQMKVYMRDKRFTVEYYGE